MRCDNCGWNNPDGLTKCQKCNQELKPAPNFNQTIMDPNKQHSAPVQQAGDSVACVKCGYPLSAGNTYCPNCGTQVAPPSPAPAPVSQNTKTVRVLPEELLVENRPEALKATVREIPVELLADNPAPKQIDNTKTVRVLPEELLQDEPAAPAPAPVPAPVPAEPELPGFKLVPMDNFDGQTPQALSFSGEKVSVDRKDIPGADSSIGEDVQVAFEYEDGQWTVSGKEGRPVVYVAASHKICLQPGDVIVVGNRRYIFE